jgi:AcrR family transcriptional regulator
MTPEVDTVNMVSESGTRAQPRAYHHGNLRAALIDAGVRLARTGGPNAVVVRAASRQAGVSHNAAYRHFASQEDLLAAVAQRCMLQLSRLMIERTQRVSARGRVQRARAALGEIGRAYIDFARSEPGWFRTAFSATHSATDGMQPAEANLPNPYDILNAALDELVRVGALAPERRPGAEYAAWAAVHGVSSLLLDGPLSELPDAEVERAIGTVLAVVNRGLS